jgi:small subunit ribosomal protein S16
MRAGRKKKPCFRIVVMDSRKRRDGAYLEQLGMYHPDVRPAPVIEVNEDRALYWLGVGAQPSDTVRNLFSHRGLMIRFDLQKRGTPEDKIATAVEKVKNAAKAREQRASQPRKAKPAAAAEAAENA